MNTKVISIVVVILIVVLLMAKQGVLALLVGGLAWLASIWRVMQVMRERREREAEQWRKVDLGPKRSKGSGSR